MLLHYHCFLQSPKVVQGTFETVYLAIFAVFFQVIQKIWINMIFCASSENLCFTIETIWVAWHPIKVNCKGIQSKLICFRNFIVSGSKNTLYHGGSSETKLISIGVHTLFTTGRPRQSHFIWSSSTVIIFVTFWIPYSLLNSKLRNWAKTKTERNQLEWNCKKRFHRT